MKKQSLFRRAPAIGQGGFALLEALVGLLIFSIGILGIVGVQASMTKAQTQSKFRVDAATLASELQGTMWSDTTNLPSYDSAACSGYAPCKDWSTKVANALPSGAPTITVAGSNVTIAITWLVPRETVPSSYVTATSVNK